MARTEGKPQMPAGEEPVVEGVFEDDPAANGKGDSLATVRGVGGIKTQTSYHTAIQVQKPRSMALFTSKVLEEAGLCGEDFYFSWPQGGQQIEGVTIGGAMIMLRHYGNCALELDLDEEGPTHWIFKATFIDLESGMSLPRLFRQRKSESHQKTGKDGDAERKLDIAFQIAQSKASRNVILRAMPEWLINKALAAAKKAEVEQITKTLSKAIAHCKEVFEKLGVSTIDLERFLGGGDFSLATAKPEATWTPNDTRSIGALYRGIIARETSVPKSFPWLAEPVTTGEAAKAAEGVASAGQGIQPPATPMTVGETAAADPVVPCVTCGEPVAGGDAIYVGPGVRFRHSKCAVPNRAQAPREDAATPPTPPTPPASQPAQPPAAGAQQALPTTPATPAETPPKGGGRRRRADDVDDGEPPADWKPEGEKK